MNEAVLTVNGLTRPYQRGLDLQAMITESLGRSAVKRGSAVGADGGPTGVAVAVNGAVVPRTQWPTTVLQPGDRIEIVGAVQGG